MFINIPFYFLLFIVGSCIGSFLNVVIDRWPKDQSIVRGRSHCDFCKKNLLPRDLIPVISFIMLQGKCRYCHKKLSWQYPIVEFSTGILLIFTWYLSHLHNLSIIPMVPGVTGLYLLIIVLYFIAIFVVDLKYEIILDDVINSAIILTFCYQIGLSVFFYFNRSIDINRDPWGPFIIFRGMVLINFLCGTIVALFFRFLIFVSRGRGLGTGDIKLGFWLGLLLGVNVIPAFFIAFVSGAIVGLFLVAVGQKKFGQTIPLAPFLVTGSYIALFWEIKLLIGIFKDFFDYTTGADYIYNCGLYYKIFTI